MRRQNRGQLWRLPARHWGLTKKLPLWSLTCRLRSEGDALGSRWNLDQSWSVWEVPDHLQPASKMVLGRHSLLAEIGVNALDKGRRGPTKFSSRQAQQTSKCGQERTQNILAPTPLSTLWSPLMGTDAVPPLFERFKSERIGTYLGFTCAFLFLKFDWLNEMPNCRKFCKGSDLPNTRSLFTKISCFGS